MVRLHPCVLDLCYTQGVDRKQAWSHYFTTGDREPLIRAYWKSIEYIAWSRYPNQQEDMFQIGMMGLLKAITKVDRNRVKSLDAWVFLNVRGMMFNVTPPKPVVSLDAEVLDEKVLMDMVSARQDEYDLGLLDDLPKREGLILKLIHVHNYKRTEVAEIFNISSARVSQIERAALKQLRSPSIRPAAPFKVKQPPKPCSKCSELANPLRRGMCRRCYEKQIWQEKKLRTSIPSL